jgi:hypothetical protein
MEGRSENSKFIQEWPFVFLEFKVQDAMLSWTGFPRGVTTSEALQSLENGVRGCKDDEEWDDDGDGEGDGEE